LTITRPPPAHAVTGPEFVTLILNSKEQPPGEKHQLMLMIGNRLAIIGYSLMRLSRRADFPISMRDSVARLTPLFAASS
jgi:hypothetical protein